MNQHTERQDYHPAALSADMLEEIRTLEHKLRSQSDEEIILIAYSQD
ncbi:hypothetical protein ACFFGV_12320 [Pontibacillus salicampi]|uniref:Uncharacterized protein n=1 Tax=Pontibacillus salicampi TaxID=1449801 RepID=A0ABV6LPK6_9BACI